MSHTKLINILYNIDCNIAYYIGFAELTDEQALFLLFLPLLLQYVTNKFLGKIIL